MSRVGKLPVSIPQTVTVTINGQVCTVKGPKGELSLTIPKGISVELKDNLLQVSRHGEEKKVKSLHGTIRNELRNFVIGVTEGFIKNMLLVGTGYRVKAVGKGLEFSLGFSHPISVTAIEGIEFKVTDQDKISVSGFDKELVGQTSANIRALRPPEPYKGKGIRYENEIIIKKAGKTSKSE